MYDLRKRNVANGRLDGIGWRRIDVRSHSGARLFGFIFRFEYNDGNREPLLAAAAAATSASS